jgi:hypothetical protein
VLNLTPPRQGNCGPSGDFHLRLACEPKVLKRLFLVSLALLPQLQDLLGPRTGACGSRQGSYPFVSVFVPSLLSPIKLTMLETPPTLSPF